MVTTPPWFGILDRLTTRAAGAWSLRRLTGSYPGPCLNVRRGTDNATQDIGFTPAGDLNVAALLGFVGGGNGFVTAWYDQMPGASHLWQSTVDRQPQIVVAGQFVGYPTWPGRCAVMTNGGAANTPGKDGSFIQSNTPAPALSYTQPFARSSVLAFPWGLSPQNGNPIVLNCHTLAYPELYQTSANTLDMWVYNVTGGGGAGFTAVSGINAGTTGVLLETFNLAGSSAVFNGAVRAGGVGDGASNMMSVGANVNGSARCTRALYGEAISFAQALPFTDAQALAINQCGYWQTPNPYRSVMLEDGPYAYWPLSETSGTVAADLSGNGRNGTYQAGAQLGAGRLMQCMDGAYLALSGVSNSNVDVSAAAQFCAGSAWSAECWANVAAYTTSGADGSHGTPWGKNTGARFLGNSTWNGGGGSASGIDWGIEAWAGNNPAYNVILWPASYQNVQTAANAAPPPGTANHYVVTYSNGTYCLYLNGVAIKSQASGKITIQAGLQIGTTGWTCGAFAGVIGEMALYASALTARQVATHYAAGIVAQTGLLDALTTVIAGAWSLRRLRGGYGGPCIRLRRDSDGAALDIGFTPTGDLDIAALLAFVGTANGFVTAWYDQTGNGLNMVQVNTDRQPLIVGSGALNTIANGSGRPGILSKGTASTIQELLAYNSALNIDQPFTRASVSSIPPGSATGGFCIMAGSVNFSVIGLNVVNLNYQMYDYTKGLTAATAAKAGSANRVTENYNGGASSIIVNGVVTSGAMGTDGAALIAAGVLTSLDGAAAVFGEVLQFGALLSSADQTTLAASQKAYWGTS
ncbi:arabinofuranosidase catalytic domain-containing protein [Caballeronia sp. BR00000012568055]|uniref:LamG-like jellyroll fold domain-containing protein n=1 Tax=Caballeronia sp. BR00000012568055 TaxID=2918761 RepID=UPI0023F63740|nr:arabinofuranosidase catalytic domain-containing protein [Caballeronia sp. BR00000012568055]